MGLTVLDVMDRARSGYLQAGRQPQAWTTNDTSMTGSQLTMSTSGHVSVPADSFLAAKDGTMEIVLNKSSDAANDLVLQERGFLETDPSAHDADIRWDISPVWPDIVLYNALVATIGSLYGYGLYAKAFSDSLTYATTAPVSLPARATGVVSMLVANGSNYFPLVEGSNFRVFNGYGPLVTSPPAVQFLGGGSQGSALKLVYKTDFLLPQDVLDADTASPPTYDNVTEVDLDDCLIPASLQPHLSMAVAAYVLQGRDVPLLDNSRVKEALANAGVQPGTRSGVARNLLSSFVTGPVTAEMARQRESAPVQILYTPAGG